MSRLWMLIFLSFFQAWAGTGGQLGTKPQAAAAAENKGIPLPLYVAPQPVAKVQETAENTFYWSLLRAIHLIRRSKEFRNVLKDLAAQEVKLDSDQLSTIISAVLKPLEISVKKRVEEITEERITRDAESQILIELDTTEQKLLASLLVLTRFETERLKEKFKDTQALTVNEAKKTMNELGKRFVKVFKEIADLSNSIAPGIKIQELVVEALRIYETAMVQSYRLKWSEDELRTLAKTQGNVERLAQTITENELLRVYKQVLEPTRWKIIAVVTLYLAFEYIAPESVRLATMLPLLATAVLAGVFPEKRKQAINAARKKQLALEEGLHNRIETAEIVAWLKSNPAAVKRLPQEEVFDVFANYVKPLLEYQDLSSDSEHLPAGLLSRLIKAIEQHLGFPYCELALANSGIKLIDKANPETP